jgi:hypothetical protein
MLNTTRNFLAIAVCIPFAACASGVDDRVREAQEGAPDWYESRKDDVLDQGYREFTDVPQSPDRKPLLEQVENEDKDLQEEIEKLKNDPKARTPQEDGLEDPADWARRIREEVEAGAPGA